MSDIKISQLNETTSLEDFYVPGSKETNGSIDTKKFNLGTIQNNINRTINSIQGNLRQFNTNEYFATGEYVLYNNNVYRFVIDHAPGNWDPSEVEYVSIYSELEYLNDPNNHETVNINVSSSDNLLELSGLGITVTLSDGTSTVYHCNSSGNCSFNVQIGLEYTIQAEPIVGYYNPESIICTSELMYRNINIIYQKTYIGDYSTIKLNFFVYNEDYTGFVQSDPLDGETVDLFPSDYTAQIISNSSATFTGRIGTTYTTVLPQKIGYRRPDDITFTVYNSNTEVNIYYKSGESGRLCVVYQVGNSILEKDVDELLQYDSTNDTYTWIGENSGVTVENAIAFHVYPYSNIKYRANNKDFIVSGTTTTISSLNPEYYDFLIKIADLVTFPYSSATPSSIYNIISTGKGTTADGLSLTYKQRNRGRLAGELGSTNPVNRISGGVFNYGDKTLHAFLGTICQLNFIFDKFYYLKNGIKVRNKLRIMEILVGGFGYVSTSINYNRYNGGAGGFSSHCSNANNSSSNLKTYMFVNNVHNTSEDWSTSAAGGISLPFYAPYEYVLYTTNIPD